MQIQIWCSKVGITQAGFLGPSVCYKLHNPPWLCQKDPSSGKKEKGNGSRRSWRIRNCVTRSGSECPGWV